ncbi:MAG: hypothetical protein Q8P29_01270 [Candidatus Levybacteria bacterium]|nr:hypothetical protein [Candidatus Levybacteria bacterium]MDZ4228572.1 hypothetical protein [Candidatus Levybacteria bacterium]
MKQTHFGILIIGLLILTYVLDAIANPLTLELATPYNYFTPEIMILYAFTTTSIVLKSIALFIAPLLLLSFMESRGVTKALILLVLSGLTQLYSLQRVLTNSQSIPLEWSLSLTLAGMALLIPAILYVILGFTQKVHKKLTGSDSDETQTQEEASDDEQTP